MYIKKGADNMQVAISKWGNSLGFRIPTNVVSALALKIGDKVNYEVRDNELILKKEKTTKEIYEEFYGKPYEEITLDDVGTCELLDWGEDVGGEIF